VGNPAPDEALPETAPRPRPSRSKAAMALRAAIEQSETTVDRDAAYVEACLAQGGYPRAELIGGRTIHVIPSTQADGDTGRSFSAAPCPTPNLP
jgi:hypothetical protein